MQYYSPPSVTWFGSELGRLDSPGCNLVLIGISCLSENPQVCFANGSCIRRWGNLGGDGEDMKTSTSSVNSKEGFATLKRSKIMTVFV